MFPDSLKGHAARPPRRWRLPAWALFFGLMASLSGFGGCGGCSSRSTTGTGDGEKRPDPIARDLLNPAITMMQPENLGIQAAAAQPAGLLNQWRAVRMKNEGKDRLSEPLPEETRTLLENQLSAAAVKRAEQDEFQEDDVAHIRTAILMKAIVDHVAQGVDGELNRAQVVFDYVTRNVQLVSEENALPLTPYEILIFGEGTAADRAWIFAGLLRQLNQDAVIIKPHAADPEESAAPWFVGAVAKGKIHVFDPLRSTPVPTELRTKSEDILPATIEDLSNRSVLETLTAGTDESLAPAAFEKVRLEIIGTGALWSPRLLNLQRLLTGENSVVISQKLTAEPEDSGSILNRLASMESPRWNPVDVRIWKHPESRLQGFEELDNLSERWKPFEAPQLIAINPETGVPTLGEFTKTQLKTRTAQLQGELREAIQGYLRIQLADKHMGAQLRGETRELHEDAAEDARFWSGVCQMELGEIKEAANQFRSYVEQAERFTGSRHADHARILWARCLNLLDQPAKAIEVLQPIGPSSPEYETAMFLQHASKTTEPATPTDDSRPGDAQKSKVQEPAIAEKPAT